MPIIEPKTKAEYEDALKKAKGTVVVDFVQQGCGACDPKQLESLTAKCPDATVMRVDCSPGSGWGDDLANDLGVEGTPTTLLAPSGEDFLAQKELEEVDPSDPDTLKRIKCAR